jgi:hypothetical protein
MRANPHQKLALRAAARLFPAVATPDIAHAAVNWRGAIEVFVALQRVVSPSETSRKPLTDGSTTGKLRPSNACVGASYSRLIFLPRHYGEDSLDFADLTILFRRSYSAQPL